MTDCEMALQALHPFFGQDVGHVAHVLGGLEHEAIANGEPGRFLATMLERGEADRGELGGVVAAIRRSLDAAKDIPDASIACGAGTDHLAPTPEVTLNEVIGAYEEQCEAVEALGGRIILMASRALAACAASSDDYARVYDHILSQIREPVIIHWRGDMFDPALAGYWGHEDTERAMDTCLSVIETHQAKVDGIKISLLDKNKEIAILRTKK